MKEVVQSFSYTHPDKPEQLNRNYFPVDVQIPRQDNNFSQFVLLTNNR